MWLIGENINVMNKVLQQAMKERKKEPIQKIALEIEKNRIDMLDINIGPARKDGPSLMEWIIKIIREVTALPLCLDTKNIEAMKIGLEMEREKAMINSIEVVEDKMEQLLPLVKKYNCKCIALLISKEGMPRDANERGALAAEFAAKVDEFEIPHQNVFFDPIVLTVAFQQDQTVATLEFMKMFKEILPDFNSTCGLSNVSNGAPENLRPLLNRTYFTMLLKYGITSAIVDGFDTELIKIARGEKENIKNLIWRGMEEEIDLKSLNEEEANYVKTINVLQGKSIYSHSWLKL